jgi:hypothetical protein
MLAASALAPLAVSVLHADDVSGAAHDAGTVRSIGLGWTGAFRALDALVAAPLQLMPIGTRAARACLASALCTAVAGAVLYGLARSLLRPKEGAPARALPFAVAAIASLAATLSWPWQSESASVAGSSLGALLSLAPLALVATPGPGSGVTPRSVFAIALAATYEPLVGVVAIVGVLPQWIAAPRGKPTASSRSALAVAALVAVVPMGIAFAEQRSALSTLSSPMAQPLGEGDPNVGLGAFLHAEVGWLGLAAAAAGAGLGLVSARTRRLALSLVLVAGIALASTRLGAPFGAARNGAPVLAATGALWVLAAVAMERAVRVVAEARIPLASASASMIVVLELTFPALSADDSAQRFDARGSPASALWSEVALGGLPPRPVVLVRAPRLLTRLMAARASGELRADASLIPLGSVVGPLAARELTLEPKLVPLWRDLLLTLAPDEWALSSLAATRALALAFEPRWERPMARHLVPAGLIGMFEPEPRGASDRARALDGFVMDRDRLAQALHVRDAGARGDAKQAAGREGADPSRTDPLVRLTADLLFDRALTFAATGERELALRSLDDARRFVPKGERMDELARRLNVATHAPMDVRDLLRAP